MTIKFSGQEVVELAVQIEKNGYEFYNEMLKRAKAKPVVDLLTYLRDEEDEHASTFRKLYGLLGPKAGPYGDEEALRYMKALADSRVFSDTNGLMDMIRQAKDEREILGLAMGFEKESLLYFYGMLDWVEADEKGVVIKLIEEEKEHLQKLLDMQGTLI